MKKKIALLLFLMIVLIIIGLVITKESFIDKLIKLIENTDKTTAENALTEMDNSSKKAKPPTAVGPDWWLHYYMPSCYDPGNTEPIKEMRVTRVHWKELIKDGSFKGTYLASDDKIVYTGTFDGKNLTFSDKAYGPTIKSMVYFSDNFSDLRGGYEIIGDVNITGCSKGTIPSGAIEGAPMSQK